MKRSPNQNATLPRRSMLQWTSGLLVTSMVCKQVSSQEKDVQQDSSASPGQDAASPDEGPSHAGTRLEFADPRTTRWKFGMILKTPVTCANVFGTFAIPLPWPEQKVNPVGQTIDGEVTGWEGRDHHELAKQVAFQMRRVVAGSEPEISFEFDIERSRILSPTKTDDLVAPPKVKGDLRRFMGNSPNIDTTNARIKKVSRDLSSQTADNAWHRVEKIYDFVREEVEYVEGPIRKASDALKSGKGDCEDMTSLFVAICRNHRIPARMVWIPDHCYPEFYLEDETGMGHWFPCQAAGTRQFGRMDEYRPILQKGDKFKVSEHRSPVRYISEFFKCDRKGKRDPNPVFVRRQIET